MAIRQVNRYPLKKLLSDSGAQGKVYLSEHPSLGKAVVLKELRLSTQKKRVQLFENEAAHIFDFQHPNVINFYDHFKKSDHYYIVTEYVPGLSVDKLLAKCPLPVDIAFLILRDIVDALMYSHEKGILHGDIKAGNFFFHEEGRVKLGDFGLSVDSNKAPEKRALMGTLSYMAPELFDRPEITKASDIYSLGVSFYTMLRSAFPFEVDPDDVIKMKQLKKGRGASFRGQPWWIRRLLKSMMHPLAHKRLPLQKIKNELDRRLRFQDEIEARAHLSAFLRRSLNEEPKTKKSFVDEKTALVSTPSKKQKSIFSGKQNFPRPDKRYLRFLSLRALVLMIASPLLVFLLLQMTVFFDSKNVIIHPEINRYSWWLYRMGLVNMDYARVELRWQIQAEKSYHLNHLQLQHFVSAVDVDDVRLEVLEDFITGEAQGSTSLAMNRRITALYREKVHGDFSKSQFTSVDLKNIAYYGFILRWHRFQANMLKIIPFVDHYPALNLKVQLILPRGRHSLLADVFRERRSLHFDLKEDAEGLALNLRVQVREKPTGYVGFYGLNSEGTIQKGLLQRVRIRLPGSLERSHRLSGLQIKRTLPYYLDLETDSEHINIIAIPVKGAYLSPGSSNYFVIQEK